MNHQRRGLTLLECLVYVSVFGMVTIFTIEAMSRARLLQGDSRDRLALATRAQEELDRLRASAPGAPTELIRHDDPWGPKTFLETAVLDGPESGTLLLMVKAGRDTYDRNLEVKLETLVRRSGS
jgi:hypothetical protein